jgi:predicted PurR-regulated permease PerM
MQETMGGVLVFVWIFLFVLAIAWIIMPFAIIGTKPILKDIRTALEENNRLLREARERLEHPTKPLHPDRS